MILALFCKNPLSGCGDMAVLKFLNFTIILSHVCILFQ